MTPDENEEMEGRPSSKWKRNDFLIGCLSFPLIAVALMILASVSLMTARVAVVLGILALFLALVAAALFYRANRDRIALGMLTGIKITVVAGPSLFILFSL